MPNFILVMVLDFLCEMRPWSDCATSLRCSYIEFHDRASTLSLVISFRVFHKCSHRHGNTLTDTHTHIHRQ